MANAAEHCRPAPQQPAAAAGGASVSRVLYGAATIQCSIPGQVTASIVDPAGRPGLRLHAASG